jgi:putative endonuclease
MSSAKQIGDYGERVAECFLVRRGYRVLTRNFASESGEIDLICRQGETLVFVEGRTRSSELFGRPAESIDARKEGALEATANDYLRLLRVDEPPFRFDAVEVRLNTGKPPKCELVVNILGT